VVGLALLAATGIGHPALAASPLLLVVLWKALTRVWRGERVPDIDAQTARFESLLLCFLLVVFVAGGALASIG
jgi:hypothetical protein